MRFLLITILIASLSGCLRKRIEYHDFRTKKSKATEGLDATAINSLLPVTPIDGSQLKVLKFTPNVKKIGQHSSMLIKAEGDPDGDYLEFTICSMEAPKKCNPGFEKPGVFVLGNHTFPDPPAKMVEVAVRSCVRPYHAIAGKPFCGPWSKSPFLQAENSPGDLAKLLTEKYYLEQKVRNECQAMHKTLSTYWQHKHIKDQINVKYKRETNEEKTSRLEQEKNEAMKSFDTAIANHMNLGEDTCSEVFLTGLMDDISGDKEIRNSKNKGLILALVIGVPVVLFGAGFIAYNYKEMRKTRDVIDSLEKKLEKHQEISGKIKLNKPDYYRAMGEFEGLLKGDPDLSKLVHERYLSYERLSDLTRNKPEISHEIRERMILGELTDEEKLALPEDVKEPYKDYATETENVLKHQGYMDAMNKFKDFGINPKTPVHTASFLQALTGHDLETTNIRAQQDLGKLRSYMGMAALAVVISVASIIQQSYSLADVDSTLTLQDNLNEHVNKIEEFLAKSTELESKINQLQP